MSSILTKVLKARGIKSQSEMTDDERREYNRWQSVLKGEKVTPEALTKFVESQLTIIQAKYATGDFTEKQDSIMRAALQIYPALLQMLNSSEADRVNMERYLTELIKNDV